MKIGETWNTLFGPHNLCSVPSNPGYSPPKNHCFVPSNSKSMFCSLKFRLWPPKKTRWLTRELRWSNLSQISNLKLSAFGGTNQTGRRTTIYFKGWASGLHFFEIASFEIALIEPEIVSDSLDNVNYVNNVTNVNSVNTSTVVCFTKTLFFKNKIGHTLTCTSGAYI